MMTMEVCFKDAFRDRVTACSQPVKRKARFSSWIAENGNLAVEDRAAVSCSGCQLSRQFLMGMPPLFRD